MADQELAEDGTVVVPLVNSAVDGWMVIHADADGGPGPVIGFAPVTAGENVSVTVPIDVAGATDTVHAMLHVDEGTKTTSSLAPTPARDDADAVVMLPFAPSGLPADAVSVASQLANEENTVVAGRARRRRRLDGHPCRPVGWSRPCRRLCAGDGGQQLQRRRRADPAIVTDTLHAMLHIDAGTAGEYEFPRRRPGQDADGNVVMLPFQIVDTVSALDSEFVPQLLRVVAGTTVTWSNDGELPHTVDADSGLFSSGEMAPGDTSSSPSRTPAPTPITAPCTAGRAAWGWPAPSSSCPANNRTNTSSLR